MHHIPALSPLAVFIDLKSVKSTVDQSGRNDFLLQDLKVSVDEVADIWPEPESQLLYVAFFTEEQHQLYLGRLTAGVPWSACRGALVFGWAPGDAVTAVRLTGVPAALPDDSIWAHFSQFGRVTRLFRSKDKVFIKANNGIAHISIAVAPGFTLPAFVSLVDQEGATDKRMLVYTDAFRRRCSRCGTTGHVAQFCKAGRRAAGADEALWSTLRIPDALLPAEEMVADTSPVQPSPPLPARPAGFIAAITNGERQAAAAQVPQLVAMARSLSTFNPAAAAAVQPSSPSPSTPSSPGGISGTGPVDTAREVVVPAGGAAPAAGAVLPAAAAESEDATPSLAVLPSSTSSTLPSLVLQLSDTMEDSLPLGQGGPPLSPELLDISPSPLPMMSPISTISLESSQDQLAASDDSLPLGQGGPQPSQELLNVSPSPLPMMPPISTISLESSQEQPRARAAAIAAVASLRSAARSRSPHSTRSASANSRDAESDTVTSYFAGTSSKGRKRAARASKAAKATKKSLTSRGILPSPSQDIFDCASP